MVTKANGPLQEDYHRLIRAAKRFGLPAIWVRMGQMEVVLPLTDAYLEKLPLRHLPASDTDVEGKPKLIW